MLKTHGIVLMTNLIRNMLLLTEKQNCVFL